MIPPGILELIIAFGAPLAFILIIALIFGMVGGRRW